MMQLFTESGMAKIDSILEHLSGFLDDLMSGKVTHGCTGIDSSLDNYFRPSQECYGSYHQVVEGKGC